MYYTALCKMYYRSMSRIGRWKQDIELVDATLVITSPHKDDAVPLVALIRHRDIDTFRTVAGLK
jgi:hypothetical protein